MPFLAAVTQPSWIANLRANGYSGEVNFWRPGQQLPATIHVGNPWVFVQKGKTPRLLLGYGVINRFEIVSIRQAWDLWGTRNGVKSLPEFVERLTKVAKETSTNGGGITNRIEGVRTLVGCVVLNNVVLLNQDEAPSVEDVLPDFPRNVVSYKIYGGNLPKQLTTPDLPTSSLVLTAPAETNFPLSGEQVNSLMVNESVNQPSIIPMLDLSIITAQFSAALQASHIHFGPRHEERVRAFIAALATKQLVILTGLSGSGKTQIALRFGQWLGPNRYKVVPVRPDWTGSEALFGYPDALGKSSEDGRPSWQVPGALAFMLRAARDPENPYLLVLDEMNLAHVERYFADVLSGMESGEQCLPNLFHEADGRWRLPVGGAEQITFPNNLLVVGTVNVDESTYMFSPKVLDRANTFEFRVDADDLKSDALKPINCAPGAPEHVRGFLAIARDDQWQADHPAAEPDTFTSHLKTVHRLLAEGGFEFGHRVYYEAIRFAAMLHGAGNADMLHALDLQVIQKVLPRLHGTRRQLEPTLCALGRFCADLTFEPRTVELGGATRFNPLEAAPDSGELPRSLEKIRRMTRSIRANQFTSFTE